MTVQPTLAGGETEAQKEFQSQERAEAGCSQLPSPHRGPCRFWGGREQAPGGACALAPTRAQHLRFLHGSQKAVEAAGEAGGGRGRPVGAAEAGAVPGPVSGSPALFMT